jgi:osmotically-inducible protein OsmY
MGMSEQKHPIRPTAPRPEGTTAGGNPASGAIEHDDQLRELIRQRLTEDPLLDATDVRVEVHNGRVTLAGTATSTRSRAEIEQMVENCGVLEVDNQLRPLS